MAVTLPLLRRKAVRRSKYAVAVWSVLVHIFLAISFVFSVAEFTLARAWLDAFKMFIYRIFNAFLALNSFQLTR